jgi:DNA-binding CsgD family transcriptional regulator
VLSEPPLDAAAPLFLANEFGASDVNKFADLARGAITAQSLDQATGRDRATSSRSREIMSPLGLGDELRVTLRSGSAVWGVLCLHRADADAGFSDGEIELVESIAPHIGAGLRRSVMVAPPSVEPAIDGVGLVVIDPATLGVLSINAVGERLLAEIAGLGTDRSGVPFVVQAVARRAVLFETPEAPLHATPLARCRTPSGHWITIQASVLTAPAGVTGVAVVLERSAPGELTSLLLKAFELTPREQAVAELVLRGYSTQQIVNELQISAHTVQDHLKSVFAKFDVGSRRELVATLLGGGPH